MHVAACSKCVWKAKPFRVLTQEIAAKVKKSLSPRSTTTFSNVRPWLLCIASFTFASIFGYISNDSFPVDYRPEINVCPPSKNKIIGIQKLIISLSIQLKKKIINSWPGSLENSEWSLHILGYPKVPNWQNILPVSFFLCHSQYPGAHFVWHWRQFSISANSFLYPAKFF